MLSGMQFAWRAAVVAAVFGVVGVLAAKAVFAHAAGGVTPAGEVRLAAWMAGLFAGGLAALLALLAVLRAGAKNRSADAE